MINEVRIVALQELLQKGAAVGIYSTAEKLFCDALIQELDTLRKLEEVRQAHERRPEELRQALGEPGATTEGRAGRHSSDGGTGHGAHPDDYQPLRPER